MMYNVGNCKISDEDIKNYLNHCINRIFAILGIFEDCEAKHNFKDYHIYLNRLITEFSGLYKMLDVDMFISLEGLLTGMNQKEDIGHDEVKSLVFHCISLVKRGANKDAVL